MDSDPSLTVKCNGCKDAKCSCSFAQLWFEYLEESARLLDHMHHRSFAGT